MSTLTNIPINSRSMNGLITISDGTAVIEDGNITTTGDLSVDNLLCTTFTTQNILVNYMQILRDSNATVNAALGFVVDIGLLVQNMIFNDNTRLYQIWNDTATAALFQVDVSNNFIDFGGTARFNSFLPTSALTPTNNTDLITKVFADTTYARLSVANSFSQTNTFLRGIVPRRFAGDQTDFQISNNAMVNRQAGSVNNIGIGISTLQGDTVSSGYVYNTGSANIALGHQALQFLDSGTNNIAIGYQALQNTGLSRVNGVGVTATRCIAIGNFSQKTSIFASDNISIGHNSFSNNVSGNGNVIIATNGGGGLNGKSGCVIIGRNSCPTASENSIISIGDGAMGAATGSTLACIAIGESALNKAQSSGSIGIGYRSLYNLTTGFDCQAWGYQAGYNAITASYSQFIGRAADTSLTSVVNSVCMGYGAITTENFEFVIGGLGGGDYPRLTIPNKTRLACNQSPTGATINLSFRSNENVQLTDASTSVINLPTPNSYNIGTKFYINRQVAGVSININAPSGQNIRINQVNGTSIILTPYIMTAGMTNLTLLCIGSTAGGANWQVIPAAISQGTDSLYLSTAIPNPSFSYSIPFGGLTTTNYEPMFMDNANLKFQPSTGTLTTTKLNLTNKTNIQNTQSFGAVSSITLSFGTNETVVINSATTSTINLPQAVVATTIHVGACFNIVRTHSSTSNIVIVAFGTEKISWKGALYSSVAIDSWVLSISVVCVDNVAGNGVWTIKGYNDRVSLATDANKIKTVEDSTNEYYAVGFTRISGVGGNDYNNVYGNSSLMYNPNPSVEMLITPNITVSGVLFDNKYTIGGQYATPTAGTVQLNFNDREYLILEASPVVTNITLPSPFITRNIGTKFTIVNRAANLSRTVSPFGSGEFIYDFNTQTTTNTFSIDKIGIAEFLCVGLPSTSTTTWVVLNRDDNLVLTGNIAQTITGNKTFSNIVSTGEFKGKQFMYQSQNTHILQATTLTNPLSSYYTFSMKASPGYAITLPEITASNVGTMITFKRLGGSLQILQITASGAQPFFALVNSLGTMTQTNTLIAGSQNCAQIVAIVSQEAVANCGLFSNTAGSTTINVTIQNTGFITIGGRLNLFGNIRHVTAFGTGNGGTGTYTIDSALPVNVNQFYSQILSYGWSATSCQ